MSRVAAFVSAARSLLVMQVLAALLAVGVTAWAFFEVRGLIAERDQLRARVTQLEAQAGQPQQMVAPVPLEPDPLLNQIVPPDVLEPSNMMDPAPDTGNVAEPVIPTETTEPGNTVVPPSRWNQRPPVTTPTPTRPQLDCNGADRGRPGCRPLPERPPIQQVPDRLTPRGDPLVPPTFTRPQPQRPTPQTRPEPRPTAQPTRPQLQINPNVVRPRPQTRPTLTRPPTQTRPPSQPPQTNTQQPSSTPPRSIVTA